MNPLHHATADAAVGPEPRTRTRTGRWGAPLLAAALAATSLPVAAQMSGDGAAADATSTAPVPPYAAGADDQTLPILDAIAAVSGYPLVHDRGFNGGKWYTDAFATNSNNHLLGRRIVRLSNGDVVVAGLVPAVNAPGNAYGNNLGLVRYNSAGVRVPWANITSGYGHFNSNYIIAPNSTSAGYTEVVDMVATGAPQNRILVLLNHTSSAGGKSVELRSFSYEGQVHAPLLTVLTKNGQPSTGAGLVYYRQGSASDPEAYKLAVIGTRFEDGKGRVVYKRLGVVPGFADETGVVDVNGAIGDCSINIQGGGCTATAVTSVDWISSTLEWLPPRIYVTGVATYNMDPDNTNFFVTRLLGGNNPATAVGRWDSTFGSGGTREVWFNAGGNNRDWATAVVAYRTLANNTSDRVYAVGQVAQTCRPGIGVAAFTHNGTAYTGIGADGKLVFGGTSVPCNQSVFKSADYANAAIRGASNPETIVIAGMSVWTPLCFPVGSCEDDVDPMLAVVGADNGAVLEQRDFPVQPGNRIRHGGLYSIRNAGNNTFAVTGDNRYFETDPNYPGAQEFVTGRFTLDRIFGNGFE